MEWFNFALEHQGADWRWRAVRTLPWRRWSIEVHPPFDKPRGVGWVSEDAAYPTGWYAVGRRWTLRGAARLAETEIRDTW